MIVVGGKVSFANGEYAKTVYFGGRFREAVSITATATEADVTTIANITSSNTATIGRRPATTACDVYFTACGYRR